MKEAKWSRNGMKMLIDSGWKEFDRQTNCITTGPGICSTQFSMCVRPWKETECNGFAFPEGHLLESDLDPFKRFNVPETVMSYLRDKGRKESVILYMFFINDHGRVSPFFWVATDYSYNMIMSRLVCPYRGKYMKRFSASMEILKYITN